MAKKKLNITPTNVTSPEIGVDTTKSITSNIIGAAQIGALDISSIDALNQSVQNREQTFQLLDTMAQDDVISAVLETYAEDIVQTNDRGKCIWVESDDPKVLDYTSWLLDSLNVEKHLYQYAYCLVKYGDVYLRLFRKSDTNDDLLFKDNKHNKRLNETVLNTDATEDKETLTEEAQLRIYANDDKYIPYVQMVDNPGEMFDLQKYGKTQGFIKAPIRIMQQSTDELSTYLTHYKTKQSQVEIYDAMSFVHGCIETTTQRQPETVDIYLDKVAEQRKLQRGDYDIDEHEITDSMTSSYLVKRGQSLLFNCFRIWRQLSLLEMSALLNRLTKSSLVRILNIDVGDMPSEQVQLYLQRLKEKIEQKAAMSVGNSISEYTNAGPIENTIYVPTHGQQGTISATSIGGDFDPKSLTDIEYFRDKLFGCLRGSMKIRLADGSEISIREAAENPELIIGKEINTCNVDGTLEKTVITNALKTKEHADFIRFTLEDNSVIEVTPEHLMMLTDGSYKEARDITEEDELMDIYYESKN